MGGMMNAKKFPSDDVNGRVQLAELIVYIKINNEISTVTNVCVS
jgi:hypothetical protein